MIVVKVMVDNTNANNLKRGKTMNKKIWNNGMKDNDDSNDNGNDYVTANINDTIQWWFVTLTTW